MSNLLEVPGAKLHYELRGEGPLVLLVGNPMDARPFTELAELLSGEYTVMTSDPRGIFRSRVDDRDAPLSIERRAGDLAALIRHADAGPAAVLGSSGGAVTTLGLAQYHPELVRLAIAHEPPLYGVLPDKDELHAAAADICATHLSGDTVGALRKFLAMANLRLPEPVIQAMGAPEDPQAIADANYMYATLLTPTVSFEPDLAALRPIVDKIVIGLGEESAGQLCDRTSRALAARLGTEPVMFPGGHVGFAEDAAAFAARLREVLAG